MLSISNAVSSQNDTDLSRYCLKHHFAQGASKYYTVINIIKRLN